VILGGGGCDSELCSQSSQCALKVLACPEGSNAPRVSKVNDENLMRQDQDRQEDGI
jgi:hypothetical protein